LRRERFDQFCDMDTQCREKVFTAKKQLATQLDELQKKSKHDIEACRTTLVESVLYFKESVKGKLETQLNETIHNIKELKVEGILQESGMPTEEHKTALDQ